MDEQKISVVIATYNGEKFVKEQIMSILNQSQKPDEIVVCDDNSNDNTIEIVEQILDNTNIQYSVLKHKENQGVAKNFFEGIKKASGDIVFLSDQDDVWLPNKIEIMSKCFKGKEKIQLVFSDAEIVNKNLLKTNKSLWQSIGFSPSPHMQANDFYSELLRRNIFTGMSLAIKRNLIDSIDDYPECMLHDELLGWKALSVGEVYPLDEKLVLYRQHDMNVVGASRHKKITSLKATKQTIRNSNYKAYSKFLYLVEKKLLTINEDELKQVLEFHEFRVRLCDGVVRKPLWKSFVYFVKMKYAKYTFKTDRAFIKDIFCILFCGQA